MTEQVIEFLSNPERDSWVRERWLAQQAGMVAVDEFREQLFAIFGVPQHLMADSTLRQLYASHVLKLPHLDAMQIDKAANFEAWTRRACAYKGYVWDDVQ